MTQRILTHLHKLRLERRKSFDAQQTLTIPQWEAHNETDSLDVPQVRIPDRSLCRNPNREAGEVLNSVMPTAGTSLTHEDIRHLEGPTHEPIEIIPVVYCESHCVGRQSCSI